MAPKGPLLFLLLLFSVLSLVSSVGESQGNYRSFLRRHVDPRRATINPHYYCQQKMAAQGLTSPTCMKRNTFIHARNSRIKLICGIGGTHANSTFSDSLASYAVTICYSKGGTPPNHCRYRGRSERRRLRVTCYRGVPVVLRKILPAELVTSNRQ